MKVSPQEIIPTRRIKSFGLRSKKGMSRYNSSINLTFLILAAAGDIEVNPGPAKRNVKYPCGICAKAVRSNQRGIQCDNCDKWLHTRCIGLSCDDYAILQSNIDAWSCKKCLSTALPFGEF